MGMNGRKDLDPVRLPPLLLYHDHFPDIGPGRCGSQVCSRHRRKRGSRAVICDNEKGMSVQITLELPDQIARQLAEVGQDLSRAALEALVLEAYRARRLSEDQAAELLGLDHHELDGFLKQHGVWLDYSIQDFEREQVLGERLWEKRRAELANDGEPPIK